MTHEPYRIYIEWDEAQYTELDITEAEIAELVEAHTQQRLAKIRLTTIINGKQQTVWQYINTNRIRQFHTEKKNPCE